MPGHVILDAIIVDNGRLGIVLSIGMLDVVEDGIGAVGELFDGWVHWSVVLGVFAEGPVVLVAHVCPADLVVEVVALLFNLLEELLLCFLMLNGLCLRLSLSLFLLCLIFLIPVFLFFRLFLSIIQLIPGVEISPIGPFPELIQPQIPNQINNLWRIESLNDIQSFFRSGQVINCIPVNIQFLS
jgi:hypothetical protein